ncbi:MAG: class I SAM-dependent methyltransferase [Methylococcales bacterium]
MSDCLVFSYEKRGKKMTEGDQVYIEALVNAKMLVEPVLELGAGYGGRTNKNIIRNAGLTYFSSDIATSNSVDYLANFESDSVAIAFRDAPRFGTVLVLNVLEHTFDPVCVLDNARSLLVQGGRLVVIVPAAWALHEYPIDCYRFLPQWFDEYAARRQLDLPREYFRYIGLNRVDTYKDTKGSYQFPKPCTNVVRYQWSRGIHRFFNTFGRGMAYPCYLAIGAVFQS